MLWLVNGPDAGQLTGAAIQSATGVGALVWALLQRAGTSAAGPVDTAVETGRAEATGGGTARTGVRRARRTGAGAATAKRTGEATASGEGSTAVSGVDYG
ncbi:hypothetical protein SL103_25980 [Streptomyces lydicus]|uniref:Uncharacterized protein n=1 Tax=Streptomyces lydicus TaxID=47763 RepID=A0A1D7VXI5_9ACTN|nr:hypothetical protein SL103_25980 [Streptomyces lydicus]